MGNGTIANGPREEKLIGHTAQYCMSGKPTEEHTLRQDASQERCDTRGAVNRPSKSREARENYVC